MSITKNLVDDYLEKWLNTEPAKEEPAYKVVDNVIFYESPYVLKTPYFLCEHLGCDAIALDQENSQHNSNRSVVAIAENEDGNSGIFKALSMGLSKYCTRLCRIDKDEVDCID